MCGIFGCVGKEVPDEPSMIRALNMLTHRGPDQAGNYQDYETEWKLWLGHRRLSILDLSEAGKQPFVTPDRKVAAAVNGEIYNTSELRPALEAKGAQFRSHSDSEILLWGFYFEGEQFFSKMRGMFAAAVWDRRGLKPRLILLRDRQGIKPMHYWIHGNAIAFASELKSICSLPEFTEKVNRFALDQYLSMRYIPAPLTIYENTCKVRPGEYIVYENGGIQHKIWWRAECPEKKFSGTLQEAEEELDRLLNESVREQLAADVPLGAFLSGGIDSSLICAITQRQFGVRKLKTFTIGFESKKEDESTYAAGIASYLGTEHYSKIMNAGDLLNLLPELPEMYDEPYSDSSAIPTALLSSFAGKQVTTVISGDGGDELFFGYNNIRTLSKVAAVDSLLPRSLRIKSMQLVQKIFKNTKIGLIGKALSYDRFDEAYLLVSGVFHKLYFDQLTGYRFDIGKSIFREICRDLEKQLPSAFSAPFFDQILYLPDDVLCKVDRAGMAYSLEVRPPILDHRIVEFANSLPYSFKYHNSCGKIVLRNVLKKYIPEKLWNRPKQGFVPPLGEWFRNELKEELCDLLSEKGIREEGCFKEDFIRQKVNEHLQGKKDNGLFLWNLFCWEKWRRDKRISL